MPTRWPWSRLSRSGRRRVFEVAALAVVASTLIVATVWMQQLSQQVEPSDWDNPNEYSSGEFVGAPSNFDGDAVTFRGEAVGDPMVRGDGAWIHLNDDPYSERSVPEGSELAGYNSGLPIWVADSELIDGVEWYGSYRAAGDIVVARGVFNAACIEHGGDIDIHASSLEVVSRGHAFTVETPGWKVALVAALAAVAFGMWRALQWRSARERGHYGAS